jgi:hypothetical protein
MIWYILTCLAGVAIGAALMLVVIGLRELGIGLARRRYRLRPLPPATARKVRRAQRAQRAHITDRAWVGQARSDVDGGPDAG